MDGDEANNQDDEKHKKSNDAAVVPFVFAATPLERKKQANDGGEESCGALQVELHDLLLPGGFNLLSAAGNREERNDEGGSYTSKRQVDVEAPSPSQVIGEGSTHEWTGDGSNAVHCSNQSHVRWSLSQRYRVCYDENGTTEDTGSSNTGDSTSDNQCGAVRRNTTDQAADLEDEQGRKVDPFDRVECVEFAVDELCRARCEKVGRSIPTDVVQCLELICNSWDSCCDDCVVLVILVSGLGPAAVSDGERLTKAMQKTDRHSAIVIMASFHACGYSNSSSSSDELASAACSGVFSSTRLEASSAAWGSADCSRTDGVFDGMALSTGSLVSPTEGLTLWVAVFSESAMLMGRRLSLFCSVIGERK